MVVDLPNMSGYPNMVKIIQYLLKTLRPSYLLSSSQVDRKVFDRICIMVSQGYIVHTT